MSTALNENFQKKFEQAAGPEEKLAIISEAKAQQESQGDIELSLDDLDSVSGGNGYWYNEPNPQEVLLSPENLEYYYGCIKTLFEMNFTLDSIIGFADQITNGMGYNDSAQWLIDGGADMWKAGWESIFAGEREYCAGCVYYHV